MIVIGISRRLAIGGLAFVLKSGIADEVEVLEPSERTMEDAGQILYKLDVCVDLSRLNDALKLISSFLFEAGFHKAYSRDLTSHPQKQMLYDWFIQPGRSLFFVHNLIDRSQVEVIMYARLDINQNGKIEIDNDIARSLAVRLENSDAIRGSISCVPS